MASQGRLSWLSAPWHTTLLRMLHRLHLFASRDDVMSSPSVPLLAPPRFAVDFLSTKMPAMCFRCYPVLPSLPFLLTPLQTGQSWVSGARLTCLPLTMHASTAGQEASRLHLEVTLTIHSAILAAVLWGYLRPTA